VAKNSLISVMHHLLHLNGHLRYFLLLAIIWFSRFCGFLAAEFYGALKWIAGQD
jgi:hypothetical protein